MNVGYDVVTLDATGREWVASETLHPDEWWAVREASRLRPFPMLTSLPDLYGDERTFSLPEVRSLIDELDYLDSAPTKPPELGRALWKLRRVALVAVQGTSPLLVHPD